MHWIWFAVGILLAGPKPAPIRRIRLNMQLLKAFFALVVLWPACTQTATAQTVYGALGSEGEPDRMQQWRVPSPDADIGAHAVLYRPPGEGPFRLAVIAHAPETVFAALAGT